MTAYYVATLARYVLVDAVDEADAREKGIAALRKRLGRDAPIAIRTVRPATADEIQLAGWDRELRDA